MNLGGNLMQIHWTKIAGIIEENDEVRTYLLECPEAFTWESGSFTHVGLKGFNDGENPNRNLVRHMSISTIPSEDKIGFTTRIRENPSEFKAKLKTLDIGDEVAIFRTFLNIPMRRDYKNLYLLSQGVGIATFRPMVMDYLNDKSNINKVHSLNIDSSRNFLFKDTFLEDAHFMSQFVDNRKEYYEQLEQFATDKNGVFYVVGSDEFILENIKTLEKYGVDKENIVLDKREDQVAQFFV